MTQPSTARRARLDALLDQGGLEQASAADRAWLTAERARDPGFDREVEALMRAEAHLLEWGGQHTGAGQRSEDALVGIFAGLDAGLFDDGLALDEAPRFADGEGDVVGLAPRVAPPVTVVAEGPRVAAAAAAPPQIKPRSTVLRDGRFMQLLVAAAAVVLVVTAGLSVVSTSSPDASEGAAALQPSAPAPTSAAVPSAAPAPMPVMPTEPEAAEASPAPEAERGFFRDARAEEQAVAAAPQAQRPMVGGAGQASVDDLLRAPAPTMASTGASSGADVGYGRGLAAESAELAMEDAPPPPVRPALAAAPATADQSTGAATTRSAARPAGAVSAGPAARYTTQAAMQQAMARCVSSPRAVTYQVARDTGTVRVLTAPGASATERRCLDLAAQQTAVTPPPGVARQQQVTLRPVSDNSAQ